MLLIVSMSGVGFLWVSRFPIVFLVRRATLKSVCLKMLVMYEVSLPIQGVPGGMCQTSGGYSLC